MSETAAYGAMDDPGSPRGRRFGVMRELAEQLIAEEHPLGELFTVPSQRAVAMSDDVTAKQIRANPRFAPTVKELADAIEEAFAAAGISVASESPPDTIADAATPEQVVTPPSPTPATGGGDPVDLAGLRFAVYAGTVPPGEIAAVSTSLTPDGTQVLTWPAGNGVYVDRIVRGDQHPPYNPDSATVVAVSAGGPVEDREPFHHAVRHYQVWRHSGPTLSEAALQQPVLVAMSVVVAPPRDVLIGVDSGAVVTATWDAEPGTAAVAVYRVPAEEAFTAGLGNPSYRIQADRPLRGGFSDADATPGRRYVYQILAEANVNGETHTSTPTLREVHYEPHDPVTDLALTLSEDEDGAWFDLTWTTPPSGRVTIYRTSRPPAAGYDVKPIAVGALVTAGLPDEARLTHPVDRDHGASTMHRVPWPREWSKAFFTPVVELSDEAYLGNTVTGIRVPPVQRVKLIERVEQKLVTFDFPEGANDVRVYVGPRDMPVLEAITGPAVASISRNDYEARGSLRLTRQQLPQQCALHFVAYSSHGTETVRSTPVSIEYTPVLLVDYQLSFGLGLTASARRPKITIRSERDLSLDPGVGFVLAFHPDRLPLTVSDATAHIALVRDVEEAADAVQRIEVGRLSTNGHAEPGWKAEPAAWSSVISGSGYVRLFLDDPRYQPYIALLDPPVGDLRVGGLIRR
ncbi:hypothetical protein [Microbacterium sp. NPDC076895]|uniref:hypothetical protein n=1 Tax=Microbacterium sp. NPDC076895 TaxID=3154957 RepID=UPI00343E30A2